MVLLLLLLVELLLLMVLLLLLMLLWLLMLLLLVLLLLVLLLLLLVNAACGWGWSSGARCHLAGHGDHNARLSLAANLLHHVRCDDDRMQLRQVPKPGQGRCVGRTTTHHPLRQRRRQPTHSCYLLQITNSNRGMVKGSGVANAINLLRAPIKAPEII